jgi:hypothetical protein
VSSATFSRRFVRLISRLVRRGVAARSAGPGTRDLDWTAVALPIPGPAV